MSWKNRVTSLLLSLLFFTPVAILLLSPTPARAVTGCDDIGAAGVELGNCLTLNKDNKVKDVFQTPADLINLLIPIAYIAAGLVMFGLLIYGGFLFITGDVKGKDKAMEMFGSAGVGFIVMFSAYWILQLIKAITGADIQF